MREWIARNKNMKKKENIIRNDNTKYGNKQCKLSWSWAERRMLELDMNRKYKQHPIDGAGEEQNTNRTKTKN